MDIAEINEEIRIEDFLASEGYQPDKIRKAGKELWYCSPLRNEETSSFKVDTSVNVWFDYGTGEGGRIFDLCKRLKNLSAKEAVYFFNREYNGNISTPQQREKHLKEIEKYKDDNAGEIIKEIKPIGNPKLLEYLKERKIDIEIANRYLSEIHYMLNGKNYYALGFKCDDAGYELRSPISKRNINGKNISTINNGSNSVKVFEGFFDFLSYATEHKTEYKNYDYIVLNTSAFVEGMLNDLAYKNVNQMYLKLLKYGRIDTYFDNDNTGKKITNSFQEMFKGSNDFSPLYQQYNDYNEFATKGRFENLFSPDESKIIPKYIERSSLQEEQNEVNKLQQKR